MKRMRIFITGGASGLGKAIATHYAKQGYAVAIGDIDPIALAQAQQQLTQYTSDVLAIDCNITALEDLESARAQIESAWGGLDILVNNAGIVGKVGLLDALAIEDWHQVLDINLLGVVRGIKAFASLFKQQGSGAIVNIASMAGITNSPTMGIYSTSKAGVIALTETLEYEMAAYGVSAHVVCPAFFETNLTKSMNSSAKTKSFVEGAMAKSSIDANDIAAMIAQQVEDGELYMMPHKRERRLWQLKRFFPKWYQRKCHKWYVKPVVKKPA
ncbi:SDR family NAD(P)-dependent oxidoreductase [Paraferrimonas sedimenticola]|nr:SDR family NAD(P)-dependent oxidoreductase [Paraferrimonas sedimenticola]